jgi:hypothetical protein
MSDSIKREFRIDSTDSARPSADINSEPTFHAQGLKPKPRVIVDVVYEELKGAAVPRGGKDISGRPLNPAKLVLKTTMYDDGVTVDTTVGEDNGEYQDYLNGIKRAAEGVVGSTRLRSPTKKPTAPKAAPKKG